MGLNFNGSHSFVLTAKLRALKAVLKSWNKDVFGIIEARKGAMLNQVAFWDKRRGLQHCPWKRLKLEMRQGRIIKSGFLGRKLRGGRNQGKCG